MGKNGFPIEFQRKTLQRILDNWPEEADYVDASEYFKSLPEGEIAIWKRAIDEAKENFKKKGYGEYIQYFCDKFGLIIRYGSPLREYYTGVTMKG